MEKNQIIGTLKQLNVQSKVDEHNREIHTVTVKVELIEKGGRENMHEIAKSLNKPIRLDFDPVQLKLQ